MKRKKRKLWLVLLCLLIFNSSWNSQVFAAGGNTAEIVRETQEQEETTKTLEEIETESETKVSLEDKLEKETEPENEEVKTEESIKETEESTEEVQVTEESKEKEEDQDTKETQEETTPASEKSDTEIQEIETQGKTEENEKEINSILSDSIQIPSTSSPDIKLLANGRSNIVVTTPSQLYGFGGYRSAFIQHDGTVSDAPGGGTSPITLHFHYGSDGNTAFCLGVNLANPDVQVTYQEADLSAAYGDKLNQVDAIVQNSVLKFSDDRKTNTLPNQWKNLTYEEAEYTAQLAIWKTLLGKPGNEPEMNGQGWFNDAWLYQNVYFPRMKNLDGGKDIKGFFEYLLGTRTVVPPTSYVSLKDASYSDGLFSVPVVVKTTEASAGTVIEIRGIPEGSKLKRADGTDANLTYNQDTQTHQFEISGSMDETLSLQLSAKESSESTVRVFVYAKSNAVSSNLVYLTPSASNYQNLIKVEPQSVKTVEGRAQLTLPKVTADVEIKKVEKGTGQPIKGIKFHVWGDNGYDAEVTTNENGICSITDLLPGNYQYQEVNAEEYGYVVNKTIYSFSVDTTGNVSGQIQSSQTQYVIENLKYCDLTITKKIKKDEIVWAHGEPTFLFEVTGQDLNGKSHTYSGFVTFTEDNLPMEDSEGWVALSYTFSNIPMGTYSVIEESVNRYLLFEISSPDGNVTINKKSEPVYESGKNSSDFYDVSVNLVQKPNGTNITFKNEKKRYDDYGDTTFAENVIPLS